jgi:hypothetical protein
MFHKLRNGLSKISNLLKNEIKNSQPKFLRISLKTSLFFQYFNKILFIKMKKNASSLLRLIKYLT